MASDYWRRRAVADRRLAARSQQVVEREIKQALRREYLRTAKNLESLYAEVQARGELSRTKLWNYRGWRDTAAELEQFCEAGSVIERDAITKCLDKVFEDVIGAPIEQFDRSKFVVRFNPRAIIDTNWSGDNYSNRIWKHNQALAERIRIMAEQVVTGTTSSGDLYRQLMREFEVTYAQAKRLVDTEISYVLNRACVERYRAYGVQKVEILNLDVNTCDHCRELEGRVYYLDDAPVLPIHPNCHCTYVVPVDGDEAPITLAGEEARRETELERQINNALQGSLPTAEQIHTRNTGIAVEDVTVRILENARPGEGAIIYAAGAEQTAKPAEIEFAEILLQTMGGSIKILRDMNNSNGVKCPDYEWNDKLWELNQPNSEKAADDRVRKGLAQINVDQNRKGGIIVDYGEKDIDIDLAIKIADTRMKRKDMRKLARNAVLMIFHKKQLIKALEYK